MHDARLYVDGQEADFYKSEELAPRITRQIFDLTQLSGAASDYTLSLVLPDSARNDLLFGWAGDLQAKQPFTRTARRNARIEVDGMVVLSGSLSIDSRTKDGYGATILGLSVAWAELLAERTLRDISTFPAWLYTGIRSERYHPWPNQAAGSVGLKDIWQTSEGGPYEMQFPMIGYGNFDSPPDPDALGASVTMGSKVVTLDNPSDLVLVKPGQRIRGPGIPNGTQVDFIGGGSTQQFDMTQAATNTQATSLVFDGTPTNPLNGRVSVARSGGIIDGALIFNSATEWSFDQFSFRGGAYLRDIIRRIFAEVGYRVGGTWYDDSSNVNLFVPFVDSGNASPQWNWGTLAVVDAVNNDSYNRQLEFYYAEFIPIDPPRTPTIPLAEVPYTGFLYADYHGGPTSPPSVGGFQVTYRSLVFYRVPFDNVLVDYSFSSRNTEYVAPVDMLADVSVSFNVAGYRLSYQEGEGRDVSAFVGTLPTSPNRRNLLMLIKGVPADISQWEGIDGNHVKDGEVIDTGGNILGWVDLSEVATGSTPSFNSSSDQGITYSFANGGQMAITLSGQLLQAGDRLSLVMVQIGALDQVLVNYLGRPGTPVYDIDIYTVQRVRIGSVHLQVGNIKKPDGTPYKTHLTAAALLPDMPQVDFIKSFIAQNNLFVATSPQTKLVTMNYADTFLLPGETAVDWSALVDMKQAVITPACRYKRFIFETAKQDGECMLDWNKFRLVVSNDNQRATDDFSLKLAFAPTAEREYLWMQNKGVRLKLPCLNTAEELAKLLGDLGSGAQQTKLDYAPRILRWDGFLAFDNQPPFAVGEFTSDALLAFPMNASASNAFSVGTGTFYWPKASVLPDFRWPGDGGLYERFYADSVRQLLNAIQAVAMVMLRPEDMQVLDQRRPVGVDGILFTVNKVEDFNPVVPQPTRCTLVRRY